jgi:hypothetical protein
MHMIADLQLDIELVVGRRRFPRRRMKQQVDENAKEKPERF